MLQCLTRAAAAVCKRIVPNQFAAAAAEPYTYMDCRKMLLREWAQMIVSLLAEK